MNVSLSCCVFLFMISIISCLILPLTIT
jgi:hypothetical protein